jgi:flagellin-specific chaperone FliS
MGSKLDDIVDELQTGMNEDVGKAGMRHLFEKLNPKELMLKSHLTDNEIKKITKILFLAEQLELPQLRQMVDVFLRLRVSLNREGRKEVISALNTITDNRTGVRGFSAMGSLMRPM